jgi:uncharacterized protein
MTDLRARLASLGYQETRPAEAAPVAPRFPSIEQLVEGSSISTPYGDCFVAERRHSTGHPHGSFRLEEALEIDPQVLPWLGRSPELAGLDFAKTVFVDTETTGLAGGTGTYAFLVGLGHFEGTRFVVRQFFMDEYGTEDALLHALAEELEPFSGVVTFNGRVFDLPLLETRFQIARRPFPLRGALHLDLLFPARRLWRERLQSCALSNLEAEVLGVERENDVPGWMIPSLYFEYVRGRDPRPLVRVFEHNRLDILSMATLLARLARQHADPFDAEWQYCEDLFSLGAVFEGMGLAERAAQCYEGAIALSPGGTLRAKTMVRLGNLYKRLRQRHDALAIWHSLASAGHGYTTFAYVELAKYHEHTTREYHEAERLTLQALAAVELRAATGSGWQVEQERRDLEHRLVRLRRKMRG